MTAAAPAFRLPGRPNFPSDLRVVLVDAVAEQSGILNQLRALNYTGEALILRDNLSRRPTSLCKIQAVSRLSGASQKAHSGTSRSYILSCEVLGYPLFETTCCATALIMIHSYV